jgi:hypothetical protein
MYTLCYALGAQKKLIMERSYLSGHTSLSYLKLLNRYIRSLESSGMYRRVVTLKWTKVSEVRTAMQN